MDNDAFFLTALASIVRHDPEVHNLNNRVWDRLDRMALDIEAHWRRA